MKNRIRRYLQPPFEEIPPFHPMCRCVVLPVEGTGRLKLFTFDCVCGTTKPYITIEASSDADAAEKLFILARTA